jgi:hypothetical protein
VLTEHPGVFLKDFGVPCSCGTYSFTGIPDVPDETLNMGGVNVLSTMYALQVQTSDVVAAGIVSGSQITANGQAFVVRDVLSVDDGVFSHLTLSK